MTEPLPSVTAILRDIGLDPDFSMVPEATLAQAQARGTAVHKAIEAIAYGYFEEAEAPAEIMPYLDAYRRFIKDSGYVASVSEVEVTHEVWRYRGHPDTVGLLGRMRGVLDWKTAATLHRRAVASQLSAYHAAWNAQHPTEPVQFASAIQLRKDGSYRVHEVDVTEGLPHFQAAVLVYYDKKEVS